MKENMIGTNKDRNENTLEMLLVRCGHHAAHHARAGFGKARVLEVLGTAGSMNQGELLDALGIQAGSLSELLSRMEEQGLLTREKDETDRRKTVLSITEKGREAMDDREDRDIFACLTAEEKEQLTALLGKLRSQWDSEIPADRPRRPRGRGRYPFFPPDRDPRVAEIPAPVRREEASK